MNNLCNWCGRELKLNEARYTSQNFDKFWHPTCFWKEHDAPKPTLEDMIRAIVREELDVLRTTESKY